MLTGKNLQNTFPSIVMWCAELRSRRCFLATVVVLPSPRALSRSPFPRGPKLQLQGPAQRGRGDANSPWAQCDSSRSWRYPASIVQRYPAPRAIAARAGRRGSNKDRPADIAHRSWATYLYFLNKRPVLTKALTSAVLAALGDILAQLVPLIFATSGVFRLDKLDVPRLLRFAAVNGLLVAPTFHLWYGWLASRLPGTNFRWALMRLIPDQLLFSPAFLFIFLSCVRSIGVNPVAWQPPSFELWWTASCINWSVLPATQFLNFWLIPLPLQVLFSNAIAVGMSAVMSYLTATY